MSARIDELKSDLTEISRLISLTSRSRVKDCLTIESRKIETELIKLQAAQEKPGTAPTSSSPKVTPSAVRCYDVKLTNYAWDQSDKFVKLFVTLKNVQALPAEQVYCDFTKRTVELSVKGLENRNYFLTINNLLKSIDETKSHWKVKSDMVVVFLSKAEPGNWETLTASESRLREAQKKSFLGGDDPADGGAGGGDSGDPSAGLMSLMKKMYNEGDDEMKRTIAKAMTESREKQSSALDL